MTNVQVVNGNTTAHFTLHFANGGSVTASIGAGSITANGCNVNAAFTGNYTIEGPAPCSWAAGPSMPSVGTRMAGVFFPGNGKFYAMGGRSSDNPGSEFTNPFEYDPGSNSWTIKSATYPDNQVNNMACAVMNQGGTDYIYCVGGSEVATQTATGRVFRYEPITDTISTVPANWPSGDQNFVPGGFSVFNNNMYILGGFEINVAMDDNIWQFDPVALTWTHKNAHLPTQLGYIPQATIGNLIYTGGGSTYDGPCFMIARSHWFMIRWPIPSVTLRRYRGPRLKREGLTSATRCMSWAAAGRPPIRRTRWTSTILWPIAGRLAHRLWKLGATSRRALMVPTKYGCQAVTRPTV